MTQGNQEGDFALLEGHQFMNLTTYRRNGQPVATPVWFARDGNKLYVMTVNNSGKVKRIRNNGRVGIAPSDRRGKVLGHEQSGLARVLPAHLAGKASDVLGKKYGLMKRFFDIAIRLRRIEQVFIEIELGKNDDNRTAAA
jgi:PPOX class probable F420-dependent enzyme